METSKKLMDEQFYVMQDFASFGRGTKLRCVFYDDYIDFIAPGRDAPRAKLYYRHILEVLYGTRTEVIQQSKALAARYLIGKSLAGNTGAMIGILSGVQNGGKKDKQVIVRYLVIGYNGKDGKEKLIALQTKSRTAGKKAEQLILEKTGKKPHTEL